MFDRVGGEAVRGLPVVLKYSVTAKRVGGLVCLVGFLQGFIKLEWPPKPWVQTSVILRMIFPHIVKT